LRVFDIIITPAAILVALILIPFIRSTDNA
jgi:hypothetical protein